MAEIILIPKRSRPYQRPPLVDTQPKGAVLRKRIGLPIYQPPRPSVPPAVIKPHSKEPARQSAPVQRPQPQAQTALTPSWPEMPTLKGLLARNPDLPLQTAVFGIGMDGLPVLLDLNDPAPGSMLVVGDERAQQIDLLRTAVTSVVLRNSARNMQFIVFSHLPGAWRSWVSEQHYDRYCLTVLGPDDPKAREWIIRLREWGEQRRSGDLGGPPVMMLMDTLNFLPKLEPALHDDFEWLAQEGPLSKIWPVAAISTALANSLWKQIGVFQTVIFGYAEDPQFYVRWAGLSEVEAQSFGHAGQFAVKVKEPDGEAWLKFRLPSPEK